MTSNSPTRFPRSARDLLKRKSLTTQSCLDNKHYRRFHDDNSAIISSSTEEGDPNVVHGAVLDQNNEYNGEVLELNLDDIQGCPCRGGCGFSYAVCEFREKACQDWMCKAFHHGCNAGYTRVQMVETEIPGCYLCGGPLEPRRNYDARRARDNKNMW